MKQLKRRESEAKLSVTKKHSSPETGHINIFLVGTGLVGQTLLSQIDASHDEIRLCGIANRTNAIVNTHGIHIKKWQQELAQSEKGSVKELIEQMIRMHLPNSVFVDCTASEEVTTYYETILSSGIPIVTPNKKANSGSMKRFKSLKKLSALHKAPFIYETNVGAGLPVVSTIKNIVLSGDKITKIEGVFSGTLSYIFNTYSSGNVSMSETVREAMNKGYTEPDPREDLNAQDTARKLLIVARVAGHNLELSQIAIHSILPADCFKPCSIEELFLKLKKLDKNFQDKKIKMLQKGKVLRHVSSIENGVAKISLREVDVNHPFHSLNGCDNIISITTERYKNAPIVIKGPGAGSEVTAGGLLANIKSIFINK